MDLGSKIFVAGHRGLVGSALVRRLQADGYSNLLLRDRSSLDLENSEQVDAFFEKERPEYVFLAAAKVGGILANATFPADFIRSNLSIQLNVIDAAHRTGVRKLMFLGSSCIYPKFAPQPIREVALLTGELEPTNEAYAIAKISGIKMCQAYNLQHGSDFISVMPTNLYGPGDNFDPEKSHVIPGLIHRIHEAKVSNAREVAIWGTGQAQREFLYSDDLADACVFLMNHYSSPQIVNIGSGEEVTIAELAQVIADVVGFNGKFLFDKSKPDGTPRKVLDVSRLHALGWRPKTRLQAGIAVAYDWYLANR